jgi:tetratricopeptide (TPR) repeat protein
MSVPMRILLLTILLLSSLPSIADVDCNDKANQIRISDRLDEAINVLGECLDEELSRVARTYLLLGLSYYEGNEQNKAIANYSKAIEFAPTYVTAFVNRGLRYTAKGNYQLALNDFADAIELDPGYMQAYYFRAYAHQKEGNHRAAINDFNTALTLTQDTNEVAAIYYNRGRVYRDLKRYDDALSDFDQAIQLKPEYTAVYFSRGLLHHKRKRTDEAIADYTRTIALDEQHARAHFNRGLLYRKDGNDFLAMKDFEAATDIDPAYARAYANRGYTMMIPIIPLLFVLGLG